MDKIQRIEAVLASRRPDRPPLGFWYHFSPDCTAGPAAVAAHLAHLETYDLDFLKVMNDNRYPVPGPISEAGGLEKLPVFQGDEQGFGRQLELIAELHSRLAGRVWMTTTIFNTWSTLRRLLAPESDAHGPPTLGPSSDPRDALLARLLGEAPAAVAHALGTIAETLARFARNCLQAGAQGIYLSVRDDWVDTPANGAGTYDRLVRPGDLAILAGAAAGSFTFLHACGRRWTSAASPATRSRCCTGRTARPARASPRRPAGCGRPCAAAWTTWGRCRTARRRIARPRCSTPCARQASGRCWSRPAVPSIPPKCRQPIFRPSAAPWMKCGRMRPAPPAGGASG